MSRTRLFGRAQPYEEEKNKDKDKDKDKVKAEDKKDSSRIFQERKREQLHARQPTGIPPKDGADAAASTQDAQPEADSHVPQKRNSPQ